MEIFKIITFFIIMILSTTFANAYPQKAIDKIPSKICLTTGCIHAASNILKNINTSTNPCDDFYKFACGGFINSITIPTDQNQVTSYSLIRDLIQERLQTIVTEKYQLDESKPFLQMKQFYQTCFNKTDIEKKGLTTMKYILGDLGGWPVVNGSNWNETGFDWKHLVYKSHKFGYNADYLISITVEINPKNSTQRIINLDEAELGFSKKYLHWGLNNNMIKAYYDYMVNVSVIFGSNRSNAERELKESLEFEMKLAKICLSPEERRNVTDLYHSMTIEELQINYASIPWNEYIQHSLGVDIGNQEIVIMKVPRHFKPLEELLKQTPARVLANYFAWRIVQNSVPYLTEDLAKQKLEFDKVVEGVEEKKQRSKECVEVVSNKMDLAVGALYARRYFNNGTRQKVGEILSDIRSVLKKLFRQIDWMDEATRESAIQKADLIIPYIAYSDELYDDKELEKYYASLPKFCNNDHLLSSLTIDLFKRSKMVAKLREPVLKTDWTSRASPSTVDALYIPLENSIGFTAGILQGVFFEHNRPAYMNYAGTGYAIGHEITHGFDDMGRQYDKDGNLNDWWAKGTSNAFIKKTQCIIEQYNNNIISELDLHLNGLNTQGENIADNGGVKEAYLGYQEWVKRNSPERQLPGLNYTPNQMFWISAASVHCSKERPEYLKLQVLMNPHSPSEFRVNLPFANNDYFAKDFDCPLGSKMNPEQKCQVW